MFDHAADLGIRVFGETISDLFTHAGLALFDLIAVTEDQDIQAYRSFTLTGEDDADLLVNWLRELLYLFNGEALLVKTIAVSVLEDLTLKARVGVVPADAVHFEINHEIKAVTYHQARVDQTKEGYWANLIFDL